MPDSAIRADFAAIGRHAKRLDKQDATALRKRIRTVVNTVGKDTLDGVRQDSRWSTGSTAREPRTAGAKGNPHTSIPAATRMRTSFAARGAGISVVTSSKLAPHARPLEGGPPGARRGTNRHKVFGMDVWVDQDVKPFFFTNAINARKALPKQLIEQLNEIAKELGF